MTPEIMFGVVVCAFMIGLSSMLLPVALSYVRQKPQRWPFVFLALDTYYMLWVAGGLAGILVMPETFGLTSNRFPTLYIVIGGHALISTIPLLAIMGPSLRASRSESDQQADSKKADDPVIRR
ncbi:MAG: hypothetical protein CMM46_15585 [Rhodospirillaceae bacterium]|nr:hypothetical protein [Rhodospirillaceae bacterium]|tara:strand:- start:10960 stop:11328 length:369 start_codon:yes stop_codon:yes gene_type:complete